MYHDGFRSHVSLVVCFCGFDFLVCTMNSQYLLEMYTNFTPEVRDMLTNYYSTFVGCDIEKLIPVKVMERLTRIDETIQKLNSGVGYDHRLRSSQIVAMVIEEYESKRRN